MKNAVLTTLSLSHKIIIKLGGVIDASLQRFVSIGASTTLSGGISHIFCVRSRFPAFGRKCPAFFNIYFFRVQNML